MVCVLNEQWWWLLKKWAWWAVWIATDVVTTSTAPIQLIGYNRRSLRPLTTTYLEQQLGI